MTYREESSQRGQRAITRRELLKHAVQLSGGLAFGRRALAASPPPNIVFILADDLGYADLSCYGHRDNKTAALDRLAGQGVMLTHGYSNSSICSPTRVALITGRYQYRLRLGLEEPLSSKTPGLGLPPSQTTLPGLLKARGYRTSLVGKWHMGGPPQFGPLKSGYERFFGIFNGATDYFTHKLMLEGKHSGGDLHEGDVPVERIGYLTDLLGERAVSEIEWAAQRKDPFMLSVHFTAPHWPWEGAEDEALAKTLKDSRHRDGGTLATYAQMMRSLDANVGRILAALDDRGLSDNTIVVFTSDNGGERFSDTWPFVGAKGELLEGGIRVPVLVRWPKRIAPGSRSEQVLISMDWLPTFVAAADETSSAEIETDGMNLLPVLTGAQSGRPRELFWRFKASEQAAVRDVNWKYLKMTDREYLFDVAVDPRERADLKRKHPDIFARLKTRFAEWNATMLPYPSESNSEVAKDNLPDRY